MADIPKSLLAEIQHLEKLIDDFKTLQSNALFNALSAKAPGAPPAPKAKFPKPADFSGDQTKFESFQLQI